MHLTIPLWPSRKGGPGYNWHVPGARLQWSGDIGTATREAMELALRLHPHTVNVTFTLS